MKKSTKEMALKLSERIDEYRGIIKYRLLEEAGKNGGQKWDSVLREELEGLTLEVLFHVHQITGAFICRSTKPKTKPKHEDTAS